MRRDFLKLLAAGLLAPRIVGAQPKYQYTVLPQEQNTDNPDKIEVVEFFWYGCPHCYNLEPQLEVWVKKLPPDVVFRRIPAIFNERWGHDAAIFYTFEALGVLDRLHRPFFDAIHRDHLRTDSQEAMTQWLSRNGVDPTKFLDTMKSFGVQSKTKRAIQLTTAYKIDGTPAMAVQGKYTVSARQTGDQGGMLEAVDYLVGMSRKKK